MTSDLPAPKDPSAVSIRSIAADALRFWERGRVFYNAVLLVVVVAYFVAGLPDSRRALDVNWLLSTFLAAVIANVLYCLAYVADVFVRVSGLHRAWSRARWVLLFIGTATAAIITRFFSIEMFLHGPWD